MQAKNVLLLVFVLVLAACGGQQEQVLPTTVPIEATEEPSPLPTATPLNLVRSTLPPAWTAAPDANTQGQPDATTAADQSGQPAATQPPTFAPATALDACTGFGEDRDRNVRTFKIGDSPQVYWTAVPGAASYSISLVDETGEKLLTDYTTDTTFTFDATLFEQTKLYGWEAYPIDPVGQQMCLARGAELFPENPLSVTQAS